MVYLVNYCVDAMVRTEMEQRAPVAEAKRRFFADFYPKHIEKEDKVFFPACRTYFPGVEE